ncbi:MAG: hypothetical protein UT37_C0007G0025 [Parcubacteria group bacterium GW2011_GWA2_39_18]|nr:MAG: hypothetical protein UT37_C0007G0025 [Parcubacteria group bacterium GW2011_GWA2_39_18]
MKKKASKNLRLAIKVDSRCKELQKLLEVTLSPREFTDFLKLKKPLVGLGGKTPRQMLCDKKSFAKLKRFIKKTPEQKLLDLLSDSDNKNKPPE